MVITLLVLALLSAAAVAEDATTAPGATSAPTTEPAVALPPETVLATVGDRKIMSGPMDRIIAGAPKDVNPEAIAAFRQRYIGNMIQQELMNALLESKKITCTDEDIAKEKKVIGDIAAKQGLTYEALVKDNKVTEAMIAERARVQKLIADTTADAKTAELIKANPTYFNGTQVTASHILIKCDYFAPTTEQKAAAAKLEAIAADIKAGKLTFEDAAKKYSDCPSKEKGGDLGGFTFEKMVPQFATAAFALKPGDTSGLVRTRFGYHVIKVTQRTEGTEKASEMANDIAKAILMSQMEDQIGAQALTTCPIVITK